jgi:hypothetical protein
MGQVYILLSQGHHTPVSSTHTNDVWRYTSTLVYILM